MDPWAGANEGLDGYANSMMALAQLKRQDAEQAQRSRLVDLQTVAAQQSVDQNQLALDDQNAKRSSLVDLYGTKEHSDPYASAVSFQAQQEQDAAGMEKKQKGFEIYLGTIKALDGMPSLDAKTKTEIGKHFLAQNPEYAPFAENLKFIDSKGVKAARMYADGELKDPVTQQPLPAGYYETEGRWTGDAANPVQLVAYKQAEPPKEVEPYKLGEIKEFQNGRTKTYKEYAGKGQWKTRSDLGTATIDKPVQPKVVIQGGGSGAARMPSAKPPVGYRYTAEGELEPIPGGPAAQKVVGAAKAQEGAVQSINTAIEAAQSLLNHPGRESATGLSSLTNALAAPGGNAKTFLNDLETFKSQMFIPMVQQMKGMGQLSDAEGKKLLAAVGNLETSSSEGAFTANLNKVIQGLQQTLKRAEQPLTTGLTGKQPARNAVKPIDATTAQRFLKQAGGNKDRARELARKAGYSF